MYGVLRGENNRKEDTLLDVVTARNASAKGLYLTTQCRRRCTKLSEGRPRCRRECDPIVGEDDVDSKKVRR